MSTPEFEHLRRQYQARVEAALHLRLPAAEQSPSQLHSAMRYACLNGGKRIRAMLVYATGEALGSDPAVLDVPACAVELIHAYSLVHDDLPAMDDDALRRGQPTCHIAHGEAIAILAGDSMQALAFELLASDPALSIAPHLRLQMIQRLAAAAGSIGMTGGQALDLDGEGRSLPLQELRAVHSAKTGALIRASVALGALTSEHAEDSVRRNGLDRYAELLGLAFQVIDDVLDEEADTDTLGKVSGADRKRHKSTYPALIGLDASKQLAADLCDQALEALASLNLSTPALTELAKVIVKRRY